MLSSSELDAIRRAPLTKAKEIMPRHDATLNVCKLETAEQFTLWAVRSWVEAYTTQSPPLERLAKGFELAGVTEGLFALDEMLTVIAVSSRVQIDVRCRRCASIGDGEIAMLGMFVAAQTGRLDDLRVGLARWLPPSAMRVAVDAARRFASALWTGGMVLPRREQSIVVPLHARFSRYPDPGIRQRQ